MLIMHAQEAVQSGEPMLQMAHLVDKQVGAAVFRRDETEALAGIEPFHGALALHLLLSHGVGGSLASCHLRLSRARLFCRWPQLCEAPAGHPSAM